MTNWTTNHRAGKPITHDGKLPCSCGIEGCEIGTLFKNRDIENAKMTIIDNAENSITFSTTQHESN